MMKKLSILVLPLVLALSAMVMLGGVSSNVIAQQNQTSTQGNQTSSQNQTSASQSPQKSSQSQDEKLLNLTTAAIQAFNSGDKKNVTSSLKTLQDTLINATGKQLVVVPAEKTTGKSSHTGGKSSGSSSSDKSGDKSGKSGG